MGHNCVSVRLDSPSSSKSEAKFEPNDLVQIRRPFDPLPQSSKLYFVAARHWMGGTVRSGVETVHSKTDGYWYELSNGSFCHSEELVLANDSALQKSES